MFSAKEEAVSKAAANQRSRSWGVGLGSPKTTDSNGLSGEQVVKIERRIGSEKRWAGERPRAIVLSVP